MIPFSRGPCLPKTVLVSRDVRSEGEGEGIETPAKRTKAEFLAWVYNQAKTEFGMDALDFAELIESDEGRKVYDDFIKAA